GNKPRQQKAHQQRQKDNSDEDQGTRMNAKYTHSFHFFKEKTDKPAKSVIDEANKKKEKENKNKKNEIKTKVQNKRSTTTTTTANDDKQPKEYESANELLSK
ncbi:hypothetical protein RFI_06426, partial [Reticulomyxa filosa]